jgi:hypothetical protein
MNKGHDEPVIGDRDFRRDRGAVSDEELARIESQDTSWNPDKSPAAMAEYEAHLLAAGGAYADLARRRKRIADLMATGMDFESARKATK